MSYGKSIDFLFNQMRNGTGSLAGGTAEFYYAGTTSFKNIYLDRNLTKIAANPYTLSADGTAELFGDGLYRIVFKDSSDVTIYDYDDVAVVDNSDILETALLNERDLFYQMTLGDVQFKKCHRDILDAADTFTLGGSPLPQYSSLDYSYYGLTGSTVTTPELIESGSYDRAFLYVQVDDTALLTYEYSTDNGATWAAFTDYINTSFSSLKIRMTWGGPGKMYSYGLFYDYYGALTVVPTGIYSSLGYSSIEDALVDIGTASAVLRIESGIQVGNSAQIIPSNVEVEVIKTGMINLNNDLTINGPFQAGLFQCFNCAGTGKVVFGSGSVTEVYPEWWGTDGSAATVRSAVAALPSTGGIVKLQAKTYRSPFDTDANKLTKDNVSIIGSKMPSFAADKSHLENGTIIQGMVDLYANNLHMECFGVDSGIAVCNAYYSGVGQEGLIIAASIAHPPATAPFTGYVAKDIIALCKDPSAAVHAFLCEYVTGAYVENIHTCYGIHGIVFKSIQTNATGLYALDNSADGVIIKADSYANCNESNFSNIEIKSTIKGVGAGLFLLGATAHLEHINISNLIVDNTSYGIKIEGSEPGLVAQHLHITNFNITNTSSISVTTNLHTHYCSLTHGTINSGSDSGVYIPTSSSYHILSDVVVRNSGGNGFDIRGIGCKLVNCIARGNAGSGLYLETPTWVDSCYFPDNTGGDISFSAWGRVASSDTQPYSGATAPTLLNSWVNLGGTNSSAGWWYSSGAIRLKGLVASGTIGQAIFNIPAPWRPAQNKRYAVPCFNGVSSVIGELIIGLNGDVVLGYGTNNYVSLDGVSYTVGVE